ncbi:unnamed protein product [Mytilus edulis]|uniref:Uncharacterized protein n=1 Tax=Mytilus edulis TaxID=6550 RepID=A0A8S3Q3Y4_MYTED|nr:unnamed protein product [Mytilus edulis]
MNIIQKHICRCLIQKCNSGNVPLSFVPARQATVLNWLLDKHRKSQLSQQPEKEDDIEQETIMEQILKLTEPENVENEIIDSDEYSVDMETKIRHIRKFIQNVQTPQSRHIDSHTTTHTLNPETIPFVPTHNIANPHNAQSLENPSVQASHTFNTQQRPTYSKEINTSNNNMLNVFISHVAVECNLEIIQNLESIGINSKEIGEDNAYNVLKPIWTV